MDSKIYRKRPFDDVHAWLDLLLMANYEEGEVMIGRTVEKVERGSLITSIVNLSERWGWSRNKTREFIKFLENENMIVRKSDNKKTCIKIVNYSVYQNLETANETAKGHQIDQQKDIKLTTNNNINNINNINNNTINESINLSSKRESCDAIKMMRQELAERLS